MSPWKKKRVRALIPAAGRGSRLADISGGLHKELLRVGPLTMIEHSLRMVIDSGVADVGVVVRPGKEEVAAAVSEYWDRAGPEIGSLTFFQQDPPRGVADAMRIAAPWAGKDPLAVVMPDNLLLGGPPALLQMLRGFRADGRDIIGAVPVHPEQAGLYGNVGLMTLAPPAKGDVRTVLTYSPKAPGVLELDGTREFFKGMVGVVYNQGWERRVEQLSPNHEGEIDDADLVRGLVEERRMSAVVFHGRAYDLGLPRGLSAARRDWEEEGPL